MFLVIILIYFVILILLELYFIATSNQKQKKYVNILPSENINESINKNLEYQISYNNINLENYIGKFYLNDNYGFYIIQDKWNLLECKKLYNFELPVKIIIHNLNKYDLTKEEEIETENIEKDTAKEIEETEETEEINQEIKNNNNEESENTENTEKIENKEIEQNTEKKLEIVEENKENKGKNKKTKNKKIKNEIKYKYNLNYIEYFIENINK